MKLQGIVSFSWRKYHFFLYTTVSISKDFEYYGLNPHPVDAFPIFFDENHSPIYIRILRFILYWLITLYGVFYFDF